MPPRTDRVRSVHRGPTAARTEGGPGHGGALTRAHPPAAPVRESSPAGAQQREERAGSSSRASPGLERRRGGRVMVVKVQRHRCSVRGLLRHGERAKGAGERCGETRWGCSPFMGGRGSTGDGWPGSLTPALMALTPLKTGEDLRGGNGPVAPEALSWAALGGQGAVAAGGGGWS
jgi:hypothetical protein